MSLLELQDVAVRSGRGARERVLLRDVSLEVDVGELAMVWGMRRSGRSTLLRVAAGVLPPSAGMVRFAGRSVSERGGAALGAGVGFFRSGLPEVDGHTPRTQMRIGPLACGASMAEASASVEQALRRAGVEQCGDMPVDELSDVDVVKVGIARAIVLEPRLLVVDEPTKGVDLASRDEVLRLLRRLADDGLAVLASTGSATELSGVDRAFTLQGGEVRGAASSRAAVIPLRGRGLVEGLG